MNSISKLSRKAGYVIMAGILAGASMAVWPGPVAHAENASISLRLPWVSGDSRVNGGNTYGPKCGDHSGKDQYAIDFQVALNRPLAAVAAGVAHTATQYDSTGQGYGKFVWVAHANGYFNTLQFNNDPTNANFGSILKATVSAPQSNYPRQIQMGVKFLW